MKVIEKSPSEPESILLMEELSEVLESITGNSGKSSFDLKDVCVPNSAFVIAYDEDEQAIGCGAIRPIDKNIVEVKRMYAKSKANGVGTKILCYLEEKAKEMGYSTLWVETRVINKTAVSFYKNRGYYPIKNYGKYVNRSEAICFEKKIDLR
jgi:N-acetylglutamate synthase-like GNAT family acetyltransferase